MVALARYGSTAAVDASSMELSFTTIQKVFHLPQYEEPKATGRTCQTGNSSSTVANVEKPLAIYSDVPRLPS